MVWSIPIPSLVFRLPPYGIDDDQVDLLEERGGEAFHTPYESIEEREEERQREHDRELAELEREIRDLRTENERLRREKRTILEQREEHTDLVRYVE